MCWYASSVKYTTETTREPPTTPFTPSSSSSLEKKPAPAGEGVKAQRKTVVMVKSVGRPHALALRHLYDKFDGSERTVLRLYRLPHHPTLSQKDACGVRSTAFSLSSNTTIPSLSRGAPDVSLFSTEVLLSTSGAESKVLLLRLRVAPHAEKESDQLWTEALCWFTNPMTGPLYSIFPSLFFTTHSQDDPVLHLYAHALDGTIVWATTDMIWRNHKRWKTHVETNTIPTLCASFSSMSRVLTTEVGDKLVKDLHFARLTWRGEEEEKKRESNPHHRHHSREKKNGHAEDPKDKRDHDHPPHHSHRPPPTVMEGFFVCSPSLPNAYVLLPSTTTTS